MTLIQNLRTGRGGKTKMLAGQKEKYSPENYCSLFHSRQTLSYSYVIVNLLPAGRPKMGGGLDLVPDTQHPKESPSKYQ